MIRSIRHKGLKRLYEDGDQRGVMGEHAAKLRDILARLDAAGAVSDMDLPTAGGSPFGCIHSRAAGRAIGR